jgi:hypothetical protein
MASSEQDTWAPTPPQPPRYTYPPQAQGTSPPPYRPPPMHVYPPRQAPPSASQVKIDSNMTMSIVSVFLFWPLGIPAIVYASKVSPALRVGDYATAQRAATDSKRWSRLAFIVGFVLITLDLFCCCLGLLGQHTGQTSPPSP